MSAHDSNRTLASLYTCTSLRAFLAVASIAVTRGLSLRIASSAKRAEVFGSTTTNSEFSVRVEAPSNNLVNVVVTVAIPHYHEDFIYKEHAPRSGRPGRGMAVERTICSKYPRSGQDRFSTPRWNARQNVDAVAIFQS